MLIIKLPRRCCRKLPSCSNFLRPRNRHSRATNVRGGFISSRELLDWKIEYEKRYRPAASLPHPRITSVTTRVDLFSSAGRMRISGDYTLVNDTNTPMDIINISMPRGARTLAAKKSYGDPT